MNILFISPIDIVETKFGGGQRSFFLHKALSAFGNVYTLIPVSLKERERSPDEENKVSWVYFEKRWSLRWIFQRTWNKIFPLIILPFYASGARKKIWPGVHFDCVVVRYTEWVAYFQAWRIAPCYVDIDDVPLELFDTLSAPKLSLMKRIVYRSLLKSWMSWVYGKCKGGWVPNSKVSALCAPLNVDFLPNLAIPPSSEFNIDYPQENMLLTIGHLGYPPNHEGIDHFLEKCWQSIRKLCPDMTYYIVGKECPLELQKKWSAYEGVYLLGFVENLEKLYERCLLTICPIEMGSGTCIKVIESVMHGRMCVATPFALRGWSEEMIAKENGILYVKTIEDMAEKVIDFYSNLSKNKIKAHSIQQFGLTQFGFSSFSETVYNTLTENSGFENAESTCRRNR